MSVRFPHADLLVSADEWRSLHRPLAEPRGLLRNHIELPDLEWTPVEFNALDDPALRPFTVGHDVFGDGAARHPSYARTHTRLDVDARPSNRWPITSACR